MIEHEGFIMFEEVFMYGPTPPLLAATVRGLFVKYPDGRYHPSEIAGWLHQPVSEIARLGVPIGRDGKIGRHEMSVWTA
jgi:hypothetical protein